MILINHFFFFVLKSKGFTNLKMSINIFTKIYFKFKKKNIYISQDEYYLITFSW